MTLSLKMSTITLQENSKLHFLLSCCSNYVPLSQISVSKMYRCCSDLDDLANADGEVDEHKDDPMSHIDMEAYIVQQLRSLHSSDRAGFESLCVALNPIQLQTIKGMLT